MGGLRGGRDLASYGTMTAAVGPSGPPGAELARAKLEELFTHWLSLEETAGKVERWLELGRAGELEAPREAASLGELTRAQQPFPRAPSSPPSTPSPKARERESAFEAFAEVGAPSRGGGGGGSLPPATRLAPLVSKRRSSLANPRLADEAGARWDRAARGDDRMPAASFAAFAAAVAGLPSVAGALIARACAEPGGPGGSGPPVVTRASFLAYWTTTLAAEYDPRLRLFAVVAKPGAKAIDAEDWAPLLDTLVAHHPGLRFLEEHAEFQRKYAATVTARLYYRVNLSRTGRISRRELAISRMPP